MKPKRSIPDTELLWVGDESGHPFLAGVPARDLVAADVDRLTFVDAGIETEAPDFADARAATVKRLIASQLYRKEPQSVG